MKTHDCIKPACSSTYQSNEEEAYYSPACAEANKVLAQKIDAQVSARPSKQKSTLQEYDKGKDRIGAAGQKIQGIHMRVNI